MGLSSMGFNGLPFSYRTMRGCWSGEAGVPEGISGAATTTGVERVAIPLEPGVRAEYFYSHTQCPPSESLLMLV